MGTMGSPAPLDPGDDESGPTTTFDVEERMYEPHHHPGHTDVDVEQGLLEEASRALGRSGSRLEAALRSYRVAIANGGLSPEEERRHLDHIASRLYALLVQRECAGATHGNLEAIRAVYDLPDAAVRRL